MGAKRAFRPIALIQGSASRVWDQQRSFTLLDCIKPGKLLYLFTLLVKDGHARSPFAWNV
jgi:hypothetical protein